jgi:hypothetical protein
VRISFTKRRLLTLATLRSLRKWNRRPRLVSYTNGHRRLYLVNNNNSLPMSIQLRFATYTFSTMARSNPIKKSQKIILLSLSPRKNSGTNPKLDRDDIGWPQGRAMQQAGMLYSSICSPICRRQPRNIPMELNPSKTNSCIRHRTMPL